MVSLKKNFLFFSSLNKRSEQGLVKLCGLGLNAQHADHKLTVLPRCWDYRTPLSHSYDSHFYVKQKYGQRLTYNHCQLWKEKSCLIICCVWWWEIKIALLESKDGDEDWLSSLTPWERNTQSDSIQSFQTLGWTHQHEDFIMDTEGQGSCTGITSPLL